MPALLLLLACRTTSVPDEQPLGEVGLVQVGEGFVSAFLLERGDQVAIFDAGQDGEALTAALAARGLSPEDVSLAFVTHGHTDHVGGLAAFPGAAIVAHPDEVPLIEQGEDGDAPTGLTVDLTLGDGERLWLADLAIEAWHVPGHTPGSLVYRVGDVLLMGDVLVAHRDGSLSGPPRTFSEDPEANDASVRALARRLPDPEGVAWLAFSHSGPVEGFEALAAF